MSNIITADIPEYAISPASILFQGNLPQGNRAKETGSPAIDDNECAEITLMAYRLSADLISRLLAKELESQVAHRGGNIIGL